MDADRQERQKSICAARDWLSGAADAIAGEDDLAGDLKVMLAHAELSRLAAARRKRVRRVLRWLVPPLAAAAVWAVVSWSGAPPAERAQAVPTPPAAPPQEQRIETRAPVTVPVQTEQAAHTAAETEGAAQTAAAPSAPQEERVPNAAQPQETQAPAPQTGSHETIPTRDMQRLMQVGGKILRE
ncbi:hypothetical protein [Selenomonas artemidis]|mgnify:FL=1|jgi:hypothetical protein|uniref:hypothetical protein n=1 Tax=Selenomonas artemidis TaxID=671224 RepID=UPI0023F16FC8|nr:hypothetical protein [Selenomonas artemidis]